MIKFYIPHSENVYTFNLEHSGSVVDRLTQDRGAAGSSLTGVTVFRP